MSQKPNIWLFTSRNFLIIEFIFIALLEVSRLIDELTNCPACWETKPEVTFGILGMRIFSLLFIIYLVSFVIYRAIKKNFKSAILPAIIVIAAIFIVDWLVRIIL